MALNRIYTRTGDEGQTRWSAASESQKTTRRIDCYGTVDELNAFIGAARTTAEDLAANRVDRLRNLASILKRVQHELFNLGSILATLPEDVHPEAASGDGGAKSSSSSGRSIRPMKICAPLRSFVLPGGSRLDAELHVCRTVCRRAERLLVRFRREHSVPPEAVRYLNRLSDALFVWSRWVNHVLGRAGDAVGTERIRERGNPLLNRRRTKRRLTCLQLQG